MLGRFRVFMGFLAGFFFLFFSHVASWEQAVIGGVIAFIGLLLRGWAAGYLEKGKKLAQDGPYRIWRHPLYAGSFFIAVGFCVAGTGENLFHSVVLWGIFSLLFFGVYPKRIREEESSLETHFGDGWREFVSNNSRYFPCFSGRKKKNPESESFQWGRYRKNKEYNAFLGVSVGYTLLVIKGLFNL